MDAVELPIRAAVAVSKLMGSEGFGRVGVTVKEVEARQSERVSILVSPGIDRCSSSFVGHKGNVIMSDEMGAVNGSESASWNKVPDTELCRHASQLSGFQGEDVPEEFNFGGTNSSLFMIPRPEGKLLQRKAGKVSRSSSGFSKRPWTAHMEDSMSEAGADEIKGISNKPRSYPTKCTFPEKTQAVKQKNNLNAKRGDKRNFKVPMRTKYDSFSLKAGLVSFSSAAGGNNILGIYGLKSDIHDVTKHVDELSLNELLDGGYKCPSLGKDKGKKASNMNENILHSVRKACSILQLRKRVHSQNLTEIDSSTCRSNLTDPSSSFKIQDSCSKPETPGNMLDFPLYQPKDILERVALPAPKDLESLLLDAAKPAVSSRNNSDPRSGKPISHRAGLPPFPWSHTFGGHCRTNSDTVKLSTSRSTCQGRWVKIGNTAKFLGGVTDCFADLESLTYDQSLVPSGGLKLGLSGNENAPSLSVNISSCERGSSSSAACSIASQVLPYSGGSLTYEGNAGHSPRLLAAAQTLYDIATHCLKQNPHGMIRWPKKPSQKVMKACKSKSNEKSEEMFATPKSVMGPDDLVKSADQMIPSKKPKLSNIEKNKDPSHANSIRKGPINWSTPRSSRSSPSKSSRDLIAETKNCNANIVKQSCMMPPPTMPPPTRVLDKACNSQEKLRKLVPMDWNRARSKLD